MKNKSGVCPHKSISTLVSRIAESGKLIAVVECTSCGDWGLETINANKTFRVKWLKVPGRKTEET